jgi:membrane protein
MKLPTFAKSTFFKSTPAKIPIMTSQIESNTGPSAANASSESLIVAPASPSTIEAPTSSLRTRAVSIRQSVWETILALTSNQNYSHASAIAFNALLSFFPFVVLLLVFCRKILHWPAGFETLLLLLKQYYLPVGQDFIIRNLRIIANNNTTALFSLGSLLFTSAGLFTPIELALNQAWGVPKERPFWRSQLIALTLVFSCGLLALGSVSIATTITTGVQVALGSWAQNSVVKVLSSLVIKTLIFPTTVGIFFLIYYFLPNCSVPFRRVLPTAVAVALVWEIVKYLFIWCLPLLDFADTYGPFYLSVTLVTWAFISAMILLFGALLSARWPE